MAGTKRERRKGTRRPSCLLHTCHRCHEFSYLIPFLCRFFSLPCCCCCCLDRFVIFLLTAGGAACSVMSLLSCEFFSYKSVDPSVLPLPYTNQTDGFVGILKFYEDDESCQFYDEILFQTTEMNIFFMIGQISSLVGPFAAILAFVINLQEWVCCRNSCSYLVAFLMLFLAFVGQGMTFMIYGQKEFWYDPNRNKINCLLFFLVLYTHISCYLSLSFFVSLAIVLTKTKA